MNESDRRICIIFLTTFLSFVKVKVKVKNLEALKLFMVDKLLTKRTLATSKSHYRNNGNGEVYCLKYTRYSRQQTTDSNMWKIDLVGFG